MSKLLTCFQETFLLSLFPQGTRITAVRFMQTMTPCPLYVRVALPDATEAEVVLRIARNREGVAREAIIFPVLARFGLPVPSVLAGPVLDPDAPEAGSMTVNSLLPGETLQAISCASAAGLELAIGLLIEAVSRLHQLTEPLRQQAAAQLLPRKTLLSDLQLLIHSGNRWVQEPLFEEAVSRLLPIVAAIQTPLVFSNGDYQPANFLSDGNRLTGFVDFEKACFEDPLITFARYPTYALDPLNKAEIVDRYLRAHGYSDYDFASRLAVFCLRTLCTKVPVSGGNTQQQERREHVLGLLGKALAALN
ncbi:MAG TPA: aminoglycoside phosphotransferase family protein [Chthonomonadaceae bacterium]|nr:aminoglycoside phosphotransferase family protein [Chthonomonadaceae bacterium]